VNKSLPPHAPRVTTCRTNPNPHSPLQQTNILQRVLSPTKQSTAPLLSLTHTSTSLRFSLATTSTVFFLALGPGMGPRRGTSARRLTAATLTHPVGCMPLPSRPAPSGYLTNCRSQLSSVSSGIQTSSLGSPGKQTVPNSVTWACTSFRKPLS
jgi:hypothetical protein